MPLGRHFLWISFLAIACRSSADLGGRCPDTEGGLRGAGSGAPDAGATGGAAGTAGAGGRGTSTGATTGTGGAARDGSAGTGASGGTGIAGSDTSGGTTGDGATVGTGGSDADGASVTSGGAGTGTGGAPGDAAVPGHCTDHRHDGDETDVDCGGSCSGCGPGALCRTDSDCGGVAVGCGDQCYCDTATSTCVYDDCFDNKTDALETDFDCGGPLCHPCELGAKCEIDTDCLSAACDLVIHECIAEQCEDHRTDGAESDVDCGGYVCAGCAVGKKCHNNLDCPSGHVCNASKVCQ